MNQKTITLLFIAILLILNSKRSKAQEQDSLMTEVGYWSNGVKKYEFLYTLSTVEFTYWHPDGKIHMQGNGEYEPHNEFYNSWDRQGNAMVKDGNGYHIDYFENGIKKFEGLIRNKLKDSLWIEYYPNGEKKSVGHYEISYGSSIKSGEWTYFYDNGQIEYTHIFSREGYNSFKNQYHRNGIKKAIVQNLDSRPILRYLNAWDTTGFQTCINGTGIYLEYNTNGNIKSTILVKDSLIDTMYTYFSNGKLKEISKYNYGDGRKLENIFYISVWDSLGNQIAKNGSGWYYEYYEDGVIFEKQYFINGVRDSLYYCYYPSGKIWQINTYKNGDLETITNYYNNEQKMSEHFFRKENEEFNGNYFTSWWYNGIVKVQNFKDSLKAYHPNGKPKSIGYYSKDTISDEKLKYAKDYYISNEIEQYEEQIDDNTYRVIVGYGGTEQCNKIWDDKGNLLREVKFENTQKLMMYEYYSNGILKSAGEIKYDIYSLPRIKNHSYSIEPTFSGYLKKGIWLYYNMAGEIESQIDMDSESIENRRIQN